MSERAKKNGFSLIELLIVVAIILIIAAIAIPNLIRAKIAANQSSAVESLRTISSAAVGYSSTYEDGYPPSLAQMGPAGGPATCNLAGLLDPVIVTGLKSGYQFTWHIGASQVPAADIPAGCAAAGYLDMFSVTADPVGFPTGTIHYCVDASGVIRENTTPVAATGAGCDPAAQPIANN